jgi:hypothetical protein
VGSVRGVSKVSSLRNSVSLYIYFYFFLFNFNCLKMGNLDEL